MSECRRPLDRLIRADQLIAVRRSVLMAIPVNVLLGLTSALVAAHYGFMVEGAVWFAASTVVNLARILHCRQVGRPRADLSDATSGSADEAAAAVDRQLRWAWILALWSGLTWAWLPVLCHGYSSPQTIFYLTVACGITAGSVTHGTAYARVPSCFITPILVVASGCLLYEGGFDRLCLSATVFLYLGALLRASRESEVAFRDASRLKNEATALAGSLRTAHARTVEVADEMTWRATHDSLTGLLNRGGFLGEVEQRLGQATGPSCLMLLDLDGFKSVNDLYGHTAGDRVLVEVAGRVMAAAPASAAVARLGGDEFAVFFELTEESGGAAELAARLVQEIAAPYHAFGTGRIGVSIGSHVTAAIDLAERLACADEALYAAKSAGRNRHQTFDDELRRRLEMRRDTERDLAGALAARALEVWFQPVYGGGGRTLTNLEALIRWRHPRHGWIPPTDIIPTAAVVGQSEALLRFILGEACTMIRTLRAGGLDHVWVAVNISPREMTQVAVDRIVLEVLGAESVPPSAIEVEITEESAMDVRAVQDKLANLSRAGIRIAVDDFGVGYSSLSTLRQLSADRIKIDRSFITGIADSADNRLLVQAILGLGRALRLDVVAEGVETASDLQTLQVFGCQFMQGYYLGRPMPANAVADWIRPAESAAVA